MARRADLRRVSSFWEPSTVPWPVVHWRQSFHNAAPRHGPIRALAGSATIKATTADYIDSAAVSRGLDVISGYRWRELLTAGLTHDQAQVIG